jgi:hypothetical protein
MTLCPTQPLALYLAMNPLPVLAMPDILLPIGVVVTMVLSGVAYGITKNRVDSAHDRIDALDRRVSATLATLEVKLDTVIRLTERIDERTRREHER